MLTAPIRLLLKAFLSPLLLFFIVWVLTGSRREGFLVALIVYSVLGILRLITRLLSSASPALILNFILNSMNSLIFLLSLVVYWVAYLVIWGNNFGLDKTFGIFR